MNNAKETVLREMMAEGMYPLIEEGNSNFKRKGYEICPFINQFNVGVRFSLESISFEEDDRGRFRDKLILRDDSGVKLVAPLAALIHYMKRADWVIDEDTLTLPRYITLSKLNNREVTITPKY